MVESAGTDESRGSTAAPPPAGRWRSAALIGVAVVSIVALALGIRCLVRDDTPAGNEAAAPSTTAPTPPTRRPTDHALSPSEGSGGPSLDVAGSRDPAAWPFASNSPWNMPIGSRAQFAAEGDPTTQALRDAGAYINAAHYSHPIYQASTSDPLRQVIDRNRGVQATIHVPDAAVPADGTDGHLHILDPDGTTVHEMWTAERNGDGNLVVGYYRPVSIRGSGIDRGARAYGGSAIGGLIRTWEIMARRIPHALAFAIPAERISSGPVWPAHREDEQNSDYTGSLPMGTLVAIPGDVDIRSLGLTPSGLVLARALQDYGAYLVDSSANFSLYAEPDAEELSQVADMRRDWESLQTHLRPITNNTATTPGGGGTPRVPLADGLTPLPS